MESKWCQIIVFLDTSEDVAPFVFGSSIKDANLLKEKWLKIISWLWPQFVPGGQQALENSGHRCKDQQSHYLCLMRKAWWFVPVMLI